jgi:AraC-like DNA-binding protein/tetratricopeptide (TPR) repeat protein
MTDSSGNDQAFIRKLTAIVLANLENASFGVKELAHESGISLYSLNRKLNLISKKTINQFIREVRLQKALEMLKTGSLTANEISFRVGFSSPAYFNTCFHEFFDYPPGQVRKDGTKESDDNIPSQVSAKKEPKRFARHTLILTFSGIIILVILTLVFIYPGSLINIKRNSFESLRSSGTRISVVVLPFLNMTNDSTVNYLTEWIPESMSSYLSNFPEELQVRNTESLYSLPESKALTKNASLAPSVTVLISQKLDANIIISGSMAANSTEIIVDAKLTNSKTGEVLKSFREEGNSEGIIQKIDTLSQKVKDYLIVSRIKKELNPEVQHLVLTRSPEALKHYVLGKDAVRDEDYSKAIGEYSEAIRIDSTFTNAYLDLIDTYEISVCGCYDKAKILCLRLYNRRDQMTIQFKLRTEYAYSTLFKMPYDCINYLKQLLELDDQQPEMYFTLGKLYKEVDQLNKGIAETEKSLEIYKKWGIKPPTADNYIFLIGAYHDAKQNKKEERFIRKAEQDFPDTPSVKWWEFRHSLNIKDTIRANDYREKFIKLSRENSVPEYFIALKVASSYKKENYPKKTEEYFQKAFTLVDSDPGQINNLAWFLILYDMNINEGLELVDKALKLLPNDPAILDTKGWGLYKQGKYKEALDFLQKADSLKPTSYEPTISFHIQEVKKAIVGQKNDH